MRSLFALTLAGTAITLPPLAQAQLKPEMETGSLIPVKPKALDSERAGEVRKGFARCVYRKSKPKVAMLLDHSDPVTVDLAGANIKNVSDDLGMETCLGSEAVLESALGLKFSPGFLRDLLAEEAYLATNAKAPQLPPPPAIVPPLEPKYVSTGNMLLRAQATVEFTDCAVRKDTAHADALLRTRPGSSGELAAARAMGPVLGQCLVQGQDIKLSAMNIRGFVAYAMWNRFGRGAAK